MMPGDDYQIVADTIENGVRHVTAVPSKLVCSKLIDFELVDGKIHNLKYMGGCNGNLKAIGALLEGASTDFALERLLGINCNNRGTSCTDQFARVLRDVLAKHSEDVL